MSWSLPVRCLGLDPEQVRRSEQFSDFHTSSFQMSSFEHTDAGESRSNFNLIALTPLKSFPISTSPFLTDGAGTSDTGDEVSHDVGFETGCGMEEG